MKLDKQITMPKVMIMITAIGILVTLVTMIIYQNNNSSIFLTLAITFGTITYHFGMRLLIGEEIARKILRRLKFDNQTIKQVTTLVRWHDRRFASFEEVNKKTIRRWVSKLTPELFARLMVVQRADINAQSDYHKEQKEQVLNETKRLFEEIIEEKNCLSIKELKINGKDLMDMGVPQGKEIGEILSWLLDQVLEQPVLNERETLTAMVKEKRDEQ